MNRSAIFDPPFWSLVTFTVKSSACLSNIGGRELVQKLVKIRHCFRILIASLKQKKINCVVKLHKYFSQCSLVPVDSTVVLPRERDIELVELRESTAWGNLVFRISFLEWRWSWHRKVDWKESFWDISLDTCPCRIFLMNSKVVRMLNCRFCYNSLIIEGCFGVL